MLQFNSEHTHTLTFTRIKAHTINTGTVLEDIVFHIVADRTDDQVCLSSCYYKHWVMCY